MLDKKTRYLQIAFNLDISQVIQVLPKIPKSDRILIEAGTPFIKREGINGIKTMRFLWGGNIVADLKTIDGAIGEVELVKNAGVTAATVMGSAPFETLDLFISKCRALGIDSMIDMIGIEDPLKVLIQLRQPPDVVILHKGRDEEGTKGKVIRYKHVARIKSKFSVIIAAAGGIDLKAARSAIFNGANIVVVNIVSQKDPWTGIRFDQDVAEIARQFLKTIE